MITSNIHYVRQCSPLLTNWPTFHIVPLTIILEKNVIVQVLKKHYTCFTGHSETANRLLLSFGLNPLNDFQFVVWDTFALIKRIMSGKHTRTQGKLFLAEFFFVHMGILREDDAWTIVKVLMEKLDRVAQMSQLDNLLSRIKECSRRFWQ